MKRRAKNGSKAKESQWFRAEVEAEMATSMRMSRRNKKIKTEENKGSQKKIEPPDGSRKQKKGN